MRFGAGTGISRLTAEAGSESIPMYLPGETPQMQHFLLFSQSSYLENFGVRNRVNSEERNCSQDGRQPAVVCRTLYPLRKGCMEKVRDLVHTHHIKESKYTEWCKSAAVLSLGTSLNSWIHKIHRLPNSGQQEQRRTKLISLHLSC